MDTLTFATTVVSGSWPIISMTGEEGVNDLFDFRITSLVREPQAGAAGVERAVLGARVALTLGQGPEQVVRSGVVTEARVSDMVNTGAGVMLHLSVRMAPTVWLLTQRRKSRIFQKVYLWEIVSQVLSEAGVRHRWHLRNKYPRRIYCTQYDETDWEFVKRLLAEEGVLFFFEHQQAFSPSAPVPGSEASDPWGVTAGVFSAVGTVSNKIGEAAGIGWPALGGSIAKVFGSLIPEPDGDEEAPMAKEGGSGAGGPAGAGDVLVFIDQPTQYAETLDPVDPQRSPLTLWLRDEADLTPGDDNAVTSFAPGAAVRPEAVESRDYDFRRPLVLLKVTRNEREEGVQVDGQAHSLEVYEHHGEYETPDINAENARNNLEQLRARATTFRAEGASPRLMPGHLFALRNGSDRTVAEGTYVPVRVVHQASNLSVLGSTALDPNEGMVRAVALAIHQASRGLGDRPQDEGWTDVELRELIRRVVSQYRPDQPLPYRCVVECVHHEVPARPPRPARTPRHVVESATVVGPRGEEIYTDKFGRVKVQFHWDRDNQWDANSSCWVRVAQPWAGAGFGFQFVPRVGMEVLVSFLRGDPDRPVIVGTLYNGTHETPEPLPQRKTRSAIRTQSSPGGGGFNELSFEDEAGLERVLLRSQKDLEIIVNDHHGRSVRGGETVTVGGAQQVVVGGDQRTGVGDDHTTRVGGNQAASVRGSRADHVVHDVDATVDGGTISRVGASSTTAVRGDVALGVQGSRVTMVKGDDHTHVGAHDNDPRLKFTRVVGESLTVARTVRLVAEPAPEGQTRSISLECGRSSIVLTDDSIELRGPKVLVRGTEQVIAHGAEAHLTLEDTHFTGKARHVTLDTQRGASLVLDNNKASVFGRRIRLEPDATEGAQELGSSTPPAPNVTLHFTHGFLPGEVVVTSTATQAGGTPREIQDTDEPQKRRREPTAIVDVAVRVTGKVVCTEARTDAEGKLRVYVPNGIKTFTVQLFAREKFEKLYGPEEDPLSFLVKMEDTMPSPMGLPGMRYRLRNLGYEPGPALGSTEIDPATEEAIMAFQRDRGVAPTGKFDVMTAQDILNIMGR
jgi:type VI secretion system secreted protein VgrG